MNKCNPKKRRAYILVSDCDVFARITSIHRLRKVITKTIIPAICLFIDYLFMLAANGPGKRFVAMARVLRLFGSSYY